jgi:hypothetical protein
VRGPTATVYGAHPLDHNWFLLHTHSPERLGGVYSYVRYVLYSTKGASHEHAAGELTKGQGQWGGAWRLR